MQHLRLRPGIRGGIHWSLLESLQKDAVIESGDSLEIGAIISKCCDLYYEELHHVARGNSHITLMGVIICYKLCPMTAGPTKDYQDPLGRNCFNEHCVRCRWCIKKCWKPQLSVCNHQKATEACLPCLT